ncbi:MAG: hypothetical protein ACYCSN_20135 [Acidobacteriaceae bacterium]
MAKPELSNSKTPNALRTQSDLDRARRALDDKIHLYSRRRKRVEIAAYVLGAIFFILSSLIFFSPKRWALSDHDAWAYVAVFFALAASGFVIDALSDGINRLLIQRHDLDAASNLEIAKLADYIDVPAVKSRMHEIAASGREITHADCRELLRDGASGHALRNAENRLVKVCSETGLRCPGPGAQA